MSKEIDQKVVSMEFDNAQFEKNVSTTMSSVEKLKQKLNFKDSSKGLENVSAAAKNVNMTGLGNAVETVRAKFSAMEVIGVTALANITNSAVNAGKRIVSALTIDPIKTGLQEYETQINAVQTILANTESKGTTLDDVNNALEELNTYADKTIYNFTEMTRNIGTFTAAGVDLDTSVSAIQGIANLAAVSGSTSQQASTAMYQLSQALASGTVKLMDWNSVVNAGMGGEVFQNALKETARVHGVAIDSMIKEEGSFRETLSEGWLTSEILTETLEKFTMATEGATEAEIKANREKLKSLGYTDEQIEGIFKLGNTSTNAATKVKTFTQLWDVLKESAQSGWAKTWQLIIGDFEEAKNLLTPLADFLTGIVNKFSDWRNKLLEGALGKTLGRLSEKIETIRKPFDKASEAVKNVKDGLEDLGKIVDEVIIGKWDNGEERFNLLSKAGYNYYEVQNKVNEKLGDSFRYSKDQIKAQDELLGKQKKTTSSTEDLSKSTEKLTEEEAERLANLAKLSDEELKSLGYKPDQIKAFRELTAISEKFGIPLKELILNMDEINGRWLLINSFKNIGKGILKVFQALKDAWSEIFPPASSDTLFNIIAGFHKLTSRLVMSDENADKLKRTFKGVFAVIKLVATFVGGAFKTAFKILSAVLGYFNLNILDVTAYIGDALVKFSNWASSVLDFRKIIDKVMPSIISLGKCIWEWIKGIKDVENIPKYILEGLINGLKNGASGLWNTIGGLVTGIIDYVKGILGIHSPSTVFIAIGGFIIAGLVAGLTGSFPTVLDFFKNIGSKISDVLGKIDFGKVFSAIISLGLVVGLIKLANALNSLASPFEGFGNVLDSASKSMKSFSTALKAEAIKSIAISILILVGAIAILTLLDTTKMLIAVGVIAVLLTGLVVVLKQIDKMGKESDVKIAKFVALLWSLSGAMLILAVVVRILGGMEWYELLTAAGGLAAIVGLIALIAKCTKLISIKDLDKFGVMMFKIGASVLLLVVATLIMAGIKEENFLKAIGGIVLLGGIVALLMWATQLSGGKQFDKIGTTILAVGAAILLLVVATRIMAGIKEENFLKAIGGIALLSGIIVGLIAATRLSGGNQFDKIGTTILAIGAAILLLVIASRIMGGIKEENFWKAIGGIALLSGIIVGLIAATKLAGSKKKLRDTGLTILLISVAIAMLATVAILLSLISIPGLIKGVVAVAILATFMAGLITATKNVKNCYKNIMWMSIAIAVMAGAVAALSFIDTASLLTATGAMIALMGMFAVIILSTKNAKDCMKNLIVMTVAISVLAGALYLIGSLPAGAALSSALALSLLMGVLAVVLVIIGNMKSVSWTAIGALAVLTVIVAGLGFVIGMITTFNVTAPMEIAKALSLLLVSMSGSLVLLSIVGIMGPAAFIGIAALATLIVGLGAILVGLGALTKHVPAVEEFLNKGIVILEKIGYALGSFVSNIVAGLAIGGLASLSQIGTYLSDFITNAMPFIEGIKLIDAGAVACAGFLAAVIVALSAANFISSITSFLSLGSSLGDLGTQLSTFITNAMPFIIGASLIKPSMMDGVKTMAEAILILTAADVLNGLTSWFTGGSSLSEFGSQLGGLGTNLKDFVRNLGTFNEAQATTVKCACSALTALTDAAKKVPNEGGLLGKLLGENSFATFGSYLPSVGTNLKDFVTNLGTFSDDNVTTVECACSALKALTDAAKNIPNEGGVLGKLLGDNSIATFGGYLPAVGTNLSDFAENLGTFSDDQVMTVECAANALGALTKAADSIPNEGGIASWFAGDNSIATFSGYLPEVGTNLKDFVTNLGTFDDAKVRTVTSAVNAINAFANLANSDLSAAKLDLPGFGKKIVKLSEKIKEFCSNMSDIGSASITTSVRNLRQIVDAIRSLDGLDSGATKEFKKAVKNLGESAVDSFVSAFTSIASKSDVKDGVKELIDVAIKGIDSKLKKVKNAFTDLVSESAKAIKTKTYKDKFYKVGSYLVDGFCNGIKENTYKAKAKAKAMAEAAEQAAKDELDINSPSKVFRAIGTSVPEGFAMGIDKLTGLVKNSSKFMADSAVDRVKTSISRIADVINSDIDTQPTIRPVIDLSDVKTGTGAISSMLDMGSSVSVRARVGSVSSMMNARIQNGDNSEVVSAIEDLGRKLNKLSGDTYTVNGVTYDDGSNINNAVKTIVRAAKIARRV